MSRVIAGSARGRRLAVPAGQGTRPTSDRAREALFSALASAVRTFAGLRVLDLYAGSGAVGLEALSRGAGHATLVESDARAVRTIRDNIRTLGLPGAELVADRVERLVAAPPAAPYEIAFADPPYGLTDVALAGVLTALDVGGWLAPGALVVVERATRGGAPIWPAGIAPDRERRYGEATLWYGRATSSR